MKLLKWLLILGASALLVLYVTKPSPADVEDFVHAQAMSQLQASDLQPSAEVLKNAALMGCRLKPETCTEALRELIHIRYDDRKIYARVTVTGLGTVNHCTAVFNRLLCRAGP